MLGVRGNPTRAKARQSISPVTAIPINANTRGEVCPAGTAKGPGTQELALSCHINVLLPRGLSRAFLVFLLTSARVADRP